LEWRDHHARRPRFRQDEAWNAWQPGHDPKDAFVRVNALRIGPDGAL